ncbi:hypothetical protein A3C96_01885 [Candidatus Uhrbacteria bacterium RIFCSPHIGHO2_02_FULL_60_10]|uniref:Uncharacterized protein n=1 Tax=Candidatus Uhrbacteria bacterium RIFCSPHIGHO2_02_FULL_60_10 TaxID=1802392 RepID=A0A1F7U5C6_9BACT|nr:MAG: hypothetical protein A3C96_01885 [Candidatus Uhrbacteria bacterium RIFCSPHIGHO2_02_FULL_60_10]
MDLTISLVAFGVLAAGTAFWFIRRWRRRPVWKVMAEGFFETVTYFHYYRQERRFARKPRANRILVDMTLVRFTDGRTELLSAPRSITCHRGTYIRIWRSRQGEYRIEHHSRGNYLGLPELPDR